MHNMKQVYLKIKSNRAIAEKVFELVLVSPKKLNLKPGTFLNLKIKECYLRRPISIADVNDKEITLIYKGVGKGSLILSTLKDGEIDCLAELGNGYSINNNKDILLIGGGAGVPPLYYLAKELIKKKKNVTILLGFNSKQDVFYEDKFKKLGVKTLTYTMDGSYGNKGLVINGIKNAKFNYFYTCGPLVMMKAIFNAVNVNGEFSLEERMGCGFGACMGCTIVSKQGPKRVCKDGPVFKKEDLLW